MKVCDSFSLDGSGKYNHQQHETTPSLTDIHERSPQILSISPADSIPPLRLSAALSSNFPPYSSWRIKIHHGKEKDTAIRRLENDSAFAREPTAVVS